MLEITLELKRVLKPTGVMYWNMGDSYYSGHPGGSIHGEITGDRYNESNIPQKLEGRPQGNMKDYQEKCLIMQNERLVIQMVDKQGWVLRNRIIWYKPNSMPSSVRDRFKNSYEPVYMFVKNNIPQYYYNTQTGESKDKAILIKNGKEGIDWRWLNEKQKSYWRSVKYYFDLDAVRLPHKTESLEKYQRQINVGLDGGNRESKYIGTEFDGVLGGKKTPLPNWFKEQHGIDKDYKEELDERQQNLLGDDIKKEEKTVPKYAKGSEFEKKYGEPWDRFGKNTNKFKKQNWDIKEEQKKAVEKEGKIGSAQRIESFFDKYGGKTNSMGKNPGDVWKISTHPFPDAHFATFPEKLIEPMILSSCPKWICKKCKKARIRIVNLGKVLMTGRSDKGKLSKSEAFTKEHHGHQFKQHEHQTTSWSKCQCNDKFEAGIVLDPFSGSCTTGIVAKRLGFNYIMIDINPDYCKMGEQRLRGTPTPLF